ncbi:MAG: Hsp20/alpha crystallin family protein [Myxococcota bacterium]
MTDRKPRALSVWDPFGDLEPFWNWPFRGVGHPTRLETMWGQPGGRFAPAIDVSENDKQYTVSAELPGTKKEDVTVELHEGTLTIRGEKRSEQEEKKEHSRHVERSFGTFSRSFTLPANADGERIKARFKDGVLTLEIPKTEEAKPRTVDIKG